MVEMNSAYKLNLFQVYLRTFEILKITFDCFINPL